MSKRNASDFTDFSNLGASDASRLLELGLSGPKRPIDGLIDRLCRPDASLWLEENLSSGPAGAFGDPVLYLVEGKATLDQLIAIKQTSKSLLGAGRKDEANLAALTSYFFAVGAALLHHQTVICSRSRDEVTEALLDLAAVAAEPWATFLSDASDAQTE